MKNDKTIIEYNLILTAGIKKYAWKSKDNLKRLENWLENYVFWIIQIGEPILWKSVCAIFRMLYSIALWNLNNRFAIRVHENPEERTKNMKNEQ